MENASRYLTLETRHRIDRYGSLLAIWGAVLGVGAFLAALYFTFHYYLAVPFEDSWSVIEELRGNHGTYNFALLWAQHNEHRVPFVRLLTMADLYWFRGENISLFAEIYFAQFLGLIAFVVALRRASQWPGWMAGVGCGLTAFAFFWVSQYQSFLNPFNVSVLSAYDFAAVSICALLLAVQQERPIFGWVLLAAGSAFVAEGNLANGLLLWPLLIIVLWRFRFPWSQRAFLSAMAILAVGLYLNGYRAQSGHANPLASLGEPGRVAEYLSVYFGSDWWNLSPSMGRMFATIGIGISAICYGVELARPQPRAFPVAMLSLCMFLLGTGLMTALGRINFPLVQAASSRYRTSSLLFWLCLSLYLMDVARRYRVRYAMIASAAALMLSTAVLPSLPTALDGAEDLRSRITAGALPLIVDVKDDPEIGRLVVPPHVAFQDRPFLLGLHAAFYADPRYALLGKALTPTFKLTPSNRCFGAFDRSRRVPDPNFPGWELYGWTWDHIAMRPVEGIVAVTDSQTISGAGLSGLPRPDVPTVHKEVSDIRVGWRTYIKGAVDFPAVKVYGVVDGGTSVCLVTPPFALSAVKPAVPTQAPSR